MNWNHFEVGFTPEEMKKDPVPPQYTRSWRHGRFLRLLRVWSTLAKELGVDYWVDFGSLMGIVRYEGQHLIPWDNDADISLLRPEFEKLNVTLNAEGRGGILRGGELGLPSDMMVTSRQEPAEGIHAKAKRRLEIIPARIIDTSTGYFLDIFTFSKVEGDFLQHWWDFPYRADWCDYTRVAIEPTEWACRPPCSHTYCWLRRASAVLPTVPCFLEGAGKLRCPQNSTQVLTDLYATPFTASYFWDAPRQNFRLWPGAE